ncbi:MAG: hypothetical protein LBJ08_06150 [Bifidobacteriaceae bacterium]|jgi:hypothetical protein|nr:hypothetical protein [Bifidobacteriaceae bacterium]
MNRTSAAPVSTSSSRAVRFPVRAAWLGLIGQRSILVLIGVWLAEAIGFGVVLNAALYRSLSADQTVDPAMTEEMGNSLHPHSLDVFAAGAIPFYGAAMALAIGALAVGNEYRFGTVRLLYSQGPGRLAVLGAQLVALVGLLGLMSLATYIADFAGLSVVSALWAWPIGAPPLGSTLTSLAATWLTVTAYGLLGAALAVLTRGIVWALTGGLIWVVGAETALTAIAGAVPWLKGPAHGLLGAATSNLAVARGAYPWWPGAMSTSVTPGEGWAAALVLAVWAIAGTGVALAAIGRRDIG